MMVFAVSGKETVVEASQQVRQDRLDAGLVEHTDKCDWISSTQDTWLGFDLNVAKGQIYVPGDKIETEIPSETSGR